MPAGSPPKPPPPPPPPPTLYEWAGGMPAIERLMDSFYRKVRQDAVLGPLFAHMSEDHPRHVAHFIAEVLGGPPLYTKERGGHPHMISRHLDRHLAQPQRADAAVGLGCARWAIPRLSRGTSTAQPIRRCPPQLPRATGGRLGIRRH